MNRCDVLVIVETDSCIKQICSALSTEGYSYESTCGSEALDRMRQGTHGMALFIPSPRSGVKNLSIVKAMRSIRPNLGIVVVAPASLPGVFRRALSETSVEILSSPFSDQELVHAACRALQCRDGRMEAARAARERVYDHYQFGRIISRNRKIRQILEIVNHLAELDATVLITGETGTGKELVAHAIHNHSARHNHRFVRINCGALTETLLESELFGHERGAFSGAVQMRRGKFEYAAGGTLLLDEIGDISMAMQLKLLRVLQEKEIQRVGGNETIHVDVRILATTNRHLEQAVKSGAFRADLYYRLNVVRIDLPPLRERMEDVPLLAEYFLRGFSKRNGRRLRGISREAMNALLLYDWPGNVRELSNVVERAAVMTTEDMIHHVELSVRNIQVGSPESCPVDLATPFKQGRQQIISQYEKNYLVSCLQRYRGNIAVSARHCEIDTKTFYRKMQEHNLDKRNFKKSGKIAGVIFGEKIGHAQ